MKGLRILAPTCGAFAGGNESFAHVLSMVELLLELSLCVKLGLLNICNLTDIHVAFKSCKSKLYTLHDSHVRAECDVLHAHCHKFHESVQLAGS